MLFAYNAFKMNKNLWLLPRSIFNITLISVINSNSSLQNIKHLLYLKKLYMFVQSSYHYRWVSGKDPLRMIDLLSSLPNRIIRFLRFCFIKSNKRNYKTEMYSWVNLGVAASIMKFS